MRAEAVAKAFRLPHQRYTTLKERLLHPRSARTHEVFRALNDVDLEVKSGEFFGIVGRNGSGKSTLLKCLAGIYAVDSGDIAVAGRLSPFIELGVGFNPELTARDNVLINAVMLGLSRSEAKRRFDKIVEFAELNEFVDLPLKNYSSGMTVRLGFAVAIEVDADILLVDEVLAVGDAAFQQKCFDQFDVMRAKGRTILFVTHDMGAVERFCDRAMLIERGSVRATGAPDDVAQLYREVNFGHTPGEGILAGSRAVRIRRAWTEDASGRETQTAQQGEPIAACMEVELHEALDQVAFSVTFRNEVLHTVFVANSGPEALQGPFHAGDQLVIRLHFENWLAPNRYTLTPTVAEEGPPSREQASVSGMPPVIDERADIASLLVEGPTWTGGVADLPVKVEVTRA